MVAADQLSKMKKEIHAPTVIGTRVKLERDGNEWLGKCPFHEDRTPSFKVWKDDTGTWLYKCFPCSANGNVFQFFERLDKIPFGAAVEKVLSISGWEEGKEAVEQVFSPMEGDKKYRTFPLSAISQAETALWLSEEAGKWFSDRGISTPDGLHLGFIQSAKAVSPDHPWVDKGWIVIPTIQNDMITCLKYRSLVAKKSEDGKISGILRGPKMATSLYNLQACQPFDDCFLVEGEPDVWALTQAGYASVGLPSAEYVPTGPERDVLVKANRIFLAGDMDTPGQTAMRKLWSELRDRTYLLEWPSGCKDANDTLLKECGGDTEKFQELIEKLKIEALEKPMQFMYDLKHSMKSMDKTNPFDDPRRLRFPWPIIDMWTPIVPGDVMTLFATESKTGKTAWLMNVLLHNALNYNRVVVNYSAELQPAAYARRAAAYLSCKDRNNLAPEDFDHAIKRVGEARFYNGYQPKASYKTVVDLLVAAKKRLGADIFVIDHLHFLTRGTKDEASAVSEAMRLLKDFAFDYGVIVIVVGQPRKMASNQRGREATAQDAKSSEAFGSDASQLFILHRDRLRDQLEGEPIFSPITKVKLDYSRESETKFTNLFFEGATCSFRQMTEQEKS